MPTNVSAERKKILSAYGANIIYTDPGDGSDGAIRKARELAAEHPDLYFYADQYSNDSNWLAHYHGTANEIWQQTEGRITHFVAMLGTSGTFMGNTRRLKELNPAIRCISLQPDSAFHGIEGAKHMATAIVPKIYDPSWRTKILRSRLKMPMPWRAALPANAECCWASLPRRVSPAACESPSRFATKKRTAAVMSRSSATPAKSI